MCVLAGSHTHTQQFPHLIVQLLLSCNQKFQNRSLLTHKKKSSKSANFFVNKIQRWFMCSQQLFSGGGERSVLVRVGDLHNQVHNCATHVVTADSLGGATLRVSFDCRQDPKTAPPARCWVSISVLRKLHVAPNGSFVFCTQRERFHSVLLI